MGRASVDLLGKCESVFSTAVAMVLPFYCLRDIHSKVTRSNKFIENWKYFQNTDSARS